MLMLAPLPQVPPDPAAPHRRYLIDLARTRRHARRAAWVGWLLGLGHRSSRLRSLSTGVPSFSGTPTSRP